MRLTATSRTSVRRMYAQVAELVDALASGASGLMVVEVRVFSWAPELGFTTSKKFQIPNKNSYLKISGCPG